ncbi:MAG: GNAT family N-acetyltransferase [Magnetococcales bacterium]|nr:GNAT family N-acetyltransferase [Magnetococcales bacterium]
MAVTEWTLSWFDSEAHIAQELWEVCFPPPLEGQWWYRSLEQAGLEDQFRFMYAVVQWLGQPVAIAPVFIMDVPLSILAPPWVDSIINRCKSLFPSLPFQRTLFVGSPCSDEGHVGIKPGVDQRFVFHTLQQALPRRARQFKASLLTWKDFPRRDDILFHELVRTYRLFALVSFPGTVCPLAGGSKEGYLATLKGSRRHNLRKKWRRSAEKVTLEVTVIQNPDMKTIDSIFCLFSKTYDKSTTKFERLNRRFFERIAQEPCVYFIVLRMPNQGEMVAFMLCFTFSGMMINKFIGIDYQRPAEWLLYFRLWEAAVEWALSRGMGSIQSGQTGYGAKILTGHRLQPLTNYCLHLNPLLHRVFSKIARSVSWRTIDDDLGNYLRLYSEMKLTQGTIET